MTTAPTSNDRGEAIRRLLHGLSSGHDAFEISAAVADLHPKHDTFPGEVYLRVGAAALELAGATAGDPIAYEGLRAIHFSECNFRGKEHRKIQFAILATASIRGGIEPDLLDETYWWNTDDFWRYALLAAIAITRAVADRLDQPVADIAHTIASHLGVDLDTSPANRR